MWKHTAPTHEAGATQRKVRNMTERFSDHTILITGAGSGLGRASAVRLASEGAALSLVDVSEEGLAATADAVREIAPDAKLLTIVADVSSDDDTQRYVDETVSTFGRLDGFFNNAGIEGRHPNPGGPPSFLPRA